MEDSAEQNENRKWLPQWYKKGQSGNPSGRPKGSKTLKTYLKERFESMTDDEREEFLEGIDKRILWEMAEGKPKQDVDTKVDGTLNITWHEHNDTLQTENTDARVSQL